MARKTNKAQAFDSLVADLHALAADLRTKADEYLRSSKAYKSDERAALVRGAAVFRLSADKIEAIVGKYEEWNGTQAVAEVPERTEAPSWPVAASPQPSDQDARPVDVQGVQAGYGYA